MKNIIRYTNAVAILIAVSTIMTACPWSAPNVDEKAFSIKRNCYILGYWDIEQKFPELSYYEKDGRITIDCKLIGSDNLIRLWLGWNLCDYRYDIEPTNEFLKLSTLYGDTDYGKFGKHINVLIDNKRIWLDNAPTSFNKIITAIDITSNAVWDDTHEAGTLLNDCFEISYKSFAKYIDSGYDEEKLQTADEIIREPLNELAADDLRLVSTVLSDIPISLTTTNPPTSAKRHNLSIIFSLDDGTTRESTVEAEFP